MFKPRIGDMYSYKFQPNTFVIVLSHTLTGNNVLVEFRDMLNCVIRVEDMTNCFEKVR
jgi:hypothetical protein